jgi:uncharacterized protein YhaN
MARTHSSIATDSEEALRSVVGPDATATVEVDPNFADANPTSTASSENIAVQRDTDDLEDSDEEITEADDEDAEDEEDEDEEDEEEDDEDEAEGEDEEEEEAVAAYQTKTFDDLGEEDDDAGDVEPGLDDEDGSEDDELDTDQVTDAALGLAPILRMAAAIRMAPSTSVRVGSSSLQ